MCKPPIRVIIAPPSHGVSRCAPLFRISKVRDDGSLHFVEAMQTLDEAKARVKQIGKLWPGDYVIDNEETGERVFASTSDETKN